VRLATKFLILVALVIPAGANAQNSAHSVCDVLDHRMQYDGKPVIVFGRAAHTMEGSWLSDDCSGKLLIGGETWGYDIWLAYSGTNEPPAPNLPEGLRWNHEELMALIPLMKNPNKYDLLDDPNCDRRPEWMAVFGRFETQKVFSRLTYASGETRNIGFGHLGGSPGQLIFRENGKFCLTLERKRPAKVNEALDLWLRIRESLLSDDGPSYFENGMKGALLPKLKGTVASSVPVAAPSTLVLQMEGSPMPEVTLRLDRSFGRPIPNGTSVEFEGVAAVFSRSPFMLTFDVPLEDLTTALAK
jgi:hypothetical protein